MFRKLEAGVIYSLLTTTRDEELIDGDYVWTGEIDTWGKYTFRQALDNGPTIYLFSDEIGTPEPVFA